MNEHIEQIKRELSLLDQEVHAAKKAAEDKRNELASAIAESVGLKVGSVVRVEATVRVNRYRVIGFSYRSYGHIHLEIQGRTIRKDGSDGEVKEIWQKWTLEEVTL